MELGDGVWKKKELLITCWNINGLRAVLEKGSLHDYLKEVKPDILCLNEIKIDLEKFIKYKI